MFTDKIYGARGSEVDRRFEVTVLVFTHTLRQMKMLYRLAAHQIQRLALSAIIVGLVILGHQVKSTAQEAAEAPDAVAVFNRAQDLHEKGNLAGAIALYEKALKVMPEFPEAEYQRGTALLAIGNVDGAEKAFRRAVELRSEWTLPLANLASLLVQRDQNAEAEMVLHKVIEAEPGSPMALAALADLRLRTNASPEVLKDVLAKIAILTAKANPSATLWTARAALENGLGKRGAAKNSLDKALAADPQNRTALLLLADLSLANGDFDRANQIAARLGPDTSDSSKLLMANIFAQETRYDEAAKQLDSLQRPGAAAAELRKRIDAGRAATPVELEKQLDVDGKNPLILGRLCSLYRRSDPAKALFFCRRASEAEPNNINHAVGFGAALVQAKQFESAVGLFRKLMAHAPDNSTAHANLATALFQLKRYDEAKQEFRWLTNAQPKSAAAYYFLGIVHDQLMEYLDASANYQQYLRLADPVENKLEIDKVNLRLPMLHKLTKDGKGKK